MSSDTNDNIRKISKDRSSIHVIIFWPELFCYPIKSVGFISSGAGFCLWLFRSSSVHPVDACTINYLLISTNQLDLVPPVPLGTSGSSFNWRHFERSVATYSTSSHLKSTICKPCWKVLSHVFVGRPVLRQPFAGAQHTATFAARCIW